MGAERRELWFTEAHGLPVATAGGTVVGRVTDLAVHAAGDHPAITHVVLARRRGTEQHVGYESVADFDDRHGVRLAGDAVISPGLPSAPALLLGRDVLDAQVVDVAGKRVRRVSDVCLHRTAHGLRVAGVDTGWRAVARRLGLPVAHRAAATAIDWADVHLTGPHGLRLGTRAAQLHRLSAVELSELVARLPPEQGAEVLEAVGPEHAAGALSAARPRLGGRLVQAIEPDAAGDILAAMPVDDAVAALRHVRSGQGTALLRRVPGARAGELRRLLAFPAKTAGGLMTTDIRLARDDEPAAQIRARLAEDPPPLEGLTTVFVVDADGRLAGALGPAALLTGAPPQPVPALRLDTPLTDVVDIFAVEDVLALPVLDAAGRPVGAVAIDDVLEELLVERLPQHRRRYRRARSRERAPA